MESGNFGDGPSSRDSHRTRGGAAPADGYSVRRKKAIGMGTDARHITGSGLGVSTTSTKTGVPNEGGGPIGNPTGLNVSLG